jgi:hypothetical protein
LTGSRRLTGAIRGVSLVFVAAWAIRSLVVTGATVLNQPFGAMLRTPPAQVQARTGSGFAQSLIPLQSLIPKTDRVYLLWDGQQDDGLRAYAYFWSSYWLYPRRVTVSSNADGIDPARFDTLVHVTLGAPPAHPQLARLTPDHVLSYADGFTVTTYRLGPPHG